MEVTLNNYFDKIFYINLDKDTNRNQNLLTQFEKYNITNYERVPGVEFTYAVEEIYWRNFNTDKVSLKYVLGSMGCRASHKNIMDMIISRNYNRVLILEDDIEFLTDPHELLRNNLSSLETWDMLYFGGAIESHFRDQIVGAYAYAVNRKIAEEISYMLPTSGMEVDNFYAKVLHHMSYNYRPGGRYEIKKILPFNQIKVNFDYNSNIR